MTTFRRWRMLVLLACLGAVALHAPLAAADALSVLRGATYLITITDAQGAFASRAVITLHGDRALSAIDSGQGGPTFFFSSQLGRGNPTARVARSAGRSTSTSPRPPMWRASITPSRSALTTRR